jgi:hypothetical protein
MKFDPAAELNPALDIAASNSLADLAARIRAEHEAATAALNSGLMSDDPRRQAQINVVFRSEHIGELHVDGLRWGAIEWSEKRAAWCIEDAEGRCLRHASSIHGQAAAKEEAVALAEQMVRDGTLPAPEEAWRLRQEAAQREREKRAKRPSEIRRKQERAQTRGQEHALFQEYLKAERDSSRAPPFFEIFAEAFNLDDPDLWQSNSFALLRPRLVIEARVAITKLEWATPRHRTPEAETALQRARKILALLEGTS